MSVEVSAKSTRVSCIERQTGGFRGVKKYRMGWNSRFGAQTCTIWDGIEIRYGREKKKTPDYSTFELQPYHYYEQILYTKPVSMTTIDNVSDCGAEGLDTRVGSISDFAGPVNKPKPVPFYANQPHRHLSL